MAGSDLKWTDLDPVGAPGVQVANVWGDHTKGAFRAFFKLPAGFSGRESGIPSAFRFLLDAAGWQLPPHDLLR
jgi:hypothetical protein